MNKKKNKKLKIIFIVILLALFVLLFYGIKDIYDMVMSSGVKAVLNFAPFKLLSTENVHVNNVDLSTELEQLSYKLNLNDGEDGDVAEEVYGIPSQLL